LNISAKLQARKAIVSVQKISREEKEGMFVDLIMRFGCKPLAEKRVTFRLSARNALSKPRCFPIHALPDAAPGENIHHAQRDPYPEVRNHLAALREKLAFVERWQHP
jgi:hypothetical protein